MEDGDALTVVVQELSKAFPSLMETLIVERDKSVLFESLTLHIPLMANF
jgi:pheromone shutdown protein TraB